MNILILDHYAGGPDLGAEYRSYYLAKFWKGQGHNVGILAGQYSHLRHRNPKLRENIERHIVGGIDYKFVATPRYVEDVTGRGRNIASYVGRTWAVAEELAAQHKPDVVLSASGYPFEVYSAQKIAKAAGAVLISQVGELWPLVYQERFDKAANSPSVKMISHAQRRAMAVSDHVVSLQPDGLNYLSKFGLSPDKWSYIPSGVVIGNEQKPVTARSGVIAEQKKPGQMVVMYCGSIGANHDLSHFVHSAALIGPDVLMVIVGNGGHKITLKRIATELECSNILFLDRPSRRGMGELMQQADCLFYSPPLLGEAYKYGMASTNLLGYMLSGKPVICDTPAPHHPVKLCEGGVVLQSRDPQEVAGGIRLLAAMSEQERSEMGMRGAEYVKVHFDYTHIAQQYMDLMGRLVAKGS